MLRITVVGCLVVLTVACTAPTPTPTLTPQPTQSSVPVTFTPRPTPRGASNPPSPSPSPNPSATAPVKPPASPSIAPPSYPAGSVIVTFDVKGEHYRILVVDPDNIAIAQQLLSGQEAPSIPNGLIVRGDPSVNTGWSWHIDPQSLEFADVTAEVCDSKPSFVEDGTLSGDRFCPWSATVIAIDPANR